MRGFAAVGLDHPKYKDNIGGVVRACGNYGAPLLVVAGTRFQKQSTDTMKMHRHMPVLQVDDLRTAIPYDCVPVAVELLQGAVSLPEYRHPERAFYIFGAEDATLERRITDWCRDIVYIPTNQCMNLAATVNVVLYDRMCKEILSKGGIK